MNVGRAGDIGVLDDAVGELDDGGGILALQVGGLDLARAALGVGAGDEVLDLVDVHLGGVGAGLLGAGGFLEEFLEQGVEEAGGDDLDVVDRHLGGLGERLALGVVQRVGHQHRAGVRAGLLVGEDGLAADDGVAGDLDELLVDVDVLDLGDQRQLGELGDELGGVLGRELELRVQHALDEGGGVFGHLDEHAQVLGGEYAAGARGRLLVEHLNGADDDVRLERHGEHGGHLEAHVHLLEGGGVGALAAEEERLAGRDDLADVAGASRKLEGEQLLARLAELHFLALVGAPEGGRVIHLLEGNLAALDEIEGHGLGLERLDDLAGRELKDGVDVLLAGSRFRDDFDEQGPAQRAGEIACGSHEEGRSWGASRPAPEGRQADD